MYRARARLITLGCLAVLELDLGHYGTRTVCIDLCLLSNLDCLTACLDTAGAAGRGDLGIRSRHSHVIRIGLYGLDDTLTSDLNLCAIDCNDSTCAPFSTIS